MNPRDLVAAAVQGDDLTARQLVKDAAREGFSWAHAPALDFTGLRDRAVYASLVELQSSRAGQAPPDWTRDVGAAPEQVFLVRAAQTSNAVLRESLENTPEPLKKRNIFALPDYLKVL
jgi:hypothetical protein